MSFDADFGTLAADTDHLLGALVHHRAEPLTLAPRRHLGSSHAAARGVRAIA